MKIPAEILVAGNQIQTFHHLLPECECGLQLHFQSDRQERSCGCHCRLHSKTETSEMKQVKGDDNDNVDTITPKKKITHKGETI